MIKEETKIRPHSFRPSIGEGHKINCPNCKEEVCFALGQWWESKCLCGEWELIHKAVLDIGEVDD